MGMAKAMATVSQFKPMLQRDKLQALTSAIFAAMR